MVRSDSGDSAANTDATSFSWSSTCSQHDHDEVSEKDSESRTGLSCTRSSRSHASTSKRAPSDRSFLFRNDDDIADSNEEVEVKSSLPLKSGCIALARTVTTPIRMLFSSVSANLKAVTRLHSRRVISLADF